MSSSQNNKIDIIYNKKILFEYPYTSSSTLKDLKKTISDVNKVDWSKLQGEELTNIFARKMAIVWKVHPFRDGNTRTIVSFSYLYAQAHGFNMDMNTFLDNLARIYNEESVRRYSIRDKFVLASLDDRDYPEVEPLSKIYQKAINNLIVDNIVIVDGRVSIKEEEEPKIVARDILGLELENQKSLKLNIINAEEETKAKLRGALKFFSGEKNNLPVYVITETGEKECGSIYCNKQILEQFEEILGKENVIID